MENRGNAYFSLTLNFSAGATSTETALPNPAPDWLVDSSWLDVSDLAKLDNFKGFDQDFTGNVAAWKGFFDSNTCYKDEVCVCVCVRVRVCVCLHVCACVCERVISGVEGLLRW